jgi:hypothetical protein
MAPFFTGITRGVGGYGFGNYVAAVSAAKYQISRSLRFNSADSSYLNRTPASTGNQQIWTWSGWVKPCRFGSQQPLFCAYSSSTNYGLFTFSASSFINATDNLKFYTTISNATQTALDTPSVFRDPSAWYHIILQVDTTQATSSNRIRIYVNGTQQTLTGTQPSQNASIAFYNDSAYSQQIGALASGTYGYFSGYLTEINFIDGQSITPSSFGETNTITGVWQPKQYTGTYGTNGFYLKFADNRLGVDLTSTATITAPFGGTAENARVSDSVYLTSNTSTGSAFTLVQEDFGSVKQLSRYLIGGVSFTGGSSTFELQYSTNGSSWTTAASLSITSSGQNFSANINVNARYVRLQATAFGVNGQGVLDSLIIYQDPLGVDSSPNSNNWNANNFSVTAGAGNDSFIDTPTPYADGGNGRGNYCTLNPLDIGSTNIAVSNGNLDFTKSSANFSPSRGTIGVATGKWYFEMLANNGTTPIKQVGVSNDYDIRAISGDTSVSSTGGIGAAWDSRGFLYQTGASGSYAYSYTTNDIVMVAFDAGSGKIWFGKNGTWNTGDPAAGTSPAFTASGYSVLSPFVNGEGGGSGSCNFGQRPFAYTPPTGFLALNTQNLPDPSIKKPSSYMDVLLWTGDGNQTRSLTGLNFQPELVWMKIRADTPQDHQLYDAVRGAGGGKCLASNTTAAEGTVNGFLDSDYGYLSSFDSTGFSVNDGAVATTGGYVNYSGRTYAAWCWDKSATPGFDIVTYTGNGSNRTIAHSLGVAPSMMIVKRRDSGVGATNWLVYHSRLNNGVNPAQYYLLLQSTNSTGGLSTIWNDTAPTSSVFSVGTNSETNGSGGTFVAYLWSEVAGFSKFGSYTGNGSSDGPFVYCGFRPRWILFKRTDAADDWSIYDTTRLTYNPQDLELFPNSSAAEYDGNRFVDILSNGFKQRIAGGAYNTSSSTVIFAAFAESSFKYSLAR